MPLKSSPRNQVSQPLPHHHSSLPCSHGPFCPCSCPCAPRLPIISGWGRPLILPQRHAVDAATYREAQEGSRPADQYHHFPTPALPTEASYRSSVRVGRRYTPPSSRSPNSTKKNGATRSIVRMGRRTFWRAILRHMETIKSEPRSLRRWQRRHPG
jgi:hypothetical protein